MVLDLSVKKGMGFSLGGRYRWDFQVAGGKGDTRKERREFAMLWREENQATM